MPAPPTPGELSETVTSCSPLPLANPCNMRQLMAAFKWYIWKMQRAGKVVQQEAGSLSLRPWKHTKLPCRAGLSARSGQSDQAQVIMEMGQGYDMDQEIEGLSSSVSRLKQVQHSVLTEP